MMLSPLFFSSGTACGTACGTAACCISHNLFEIDEEIDEALWSDD